MFGDFRRIELILLSGIIEVTFSGEAANPAFPPMLSKRRTAGKPQLSVIGFCCQRIHPPLPAAKQAPAVSIGTGNGAAVVTINGRGRFGGAGGEEKYK